VCITSPAVNDLYSALNASKVKIGYAINYSIAGPVYVLSEGVIRLEDLAWTALTQEKMNEMFRTIQADSGTGIVYRYCGCEEGDTDWIKWLNRSPEIFGFIKLTIEVRPLGFMCHDAWLTNG
jgi:hypothetical protein